MKTICIAGKNNIAVDLLLHCMKFYPNCRLVCIANKNDSGINNWQKSLKFFAKKNDVEILQLQDVYTLSDLLFLSCEFDSIIKPEKFRSNELFNIHFSLLPKYKGCHTSVLPILWGDIFTGVTLHKIRAGIDTGEIIDQQKVDILENDNSLDLYKKLIQSGTDIAIRNLDKLLRKNFDYFKQSQNGSTYYPRNFIDFSKLTLNVNRTAFQIKNQIRAFSFRPYQLISWNGINYIDSKILKFVSTQRPGTILEDTDVYTVITSADYNILLFKDTLDQANELIKQGKDARTFLVSEKIINSQECHGWSPLTIAVYNNNLFMAEWLIKNKADINVVNNNGTTLLMYAKDCFKNTGDPSVFELLLNAGISTENKDFNGLNLKNYCDMEGIRQIGKYSF